MIGLDAALRWLLWAIHHSQISTDTFNFFRDRVVKAARAASAAKGFDDLLSGANRVIVPLNVYRRSDIIGIFTKSFLAEARSAYGNVHITLSREASLYFSSSLFVGYYATTVICRTPRSILRRVIARYVLPDGHDVVC